ncbi:unnamed protein product [Amoebophrya sp. A120]|nr:unnamed protein product [Amoebophrya sp. A120]|eukprot:GSA120T00016006001.1
MSCSTRRLLIKWEFNTKWEISYFIYTLSDNSIRCISSCKILSDLDYGLLHLLRLSSCGLSKSEFCRGGVY